MKALGHVCDGLLIGLVGPLAGIGVAIGLQSIGIIGAATPRLTAQRAAAPVVAQAADWRTAGRNAALAYFGSDRPTQAVRHMADWVVSHQDNGAAPFLVIDKVDARLYVFRPDGALLGTTPVLLGAARGDDAYPGIGQVPVPDVMPWQRTTPAGRFVTRPGFDDEHHDVVWIDYDAAVALHRVIDKVRSERRPERLASPIADDRRISYGCVNVPIAFFDHVIAPLFGARRGVAYIIPEVRSFRAVFEQHLEPAAILGDTSPPASQPPATLPLQSAVR